MSNYIVLRSKAIDTIDVQSSAFCELSDGSIVIGIGLGDLCIWNPLTDQVLHRIKKAHSNFIYTMFAVESISNATTIITASCDYT